MPPANNVMGGTNAMRCFVLMLVAASLTGCSEYLDRRDGISMQAGNALQTDKVTQMVDPWPAVSADRNIASNGVAMETAVARYRTGTVIQPVGTSGTAAVTPPPPPADPKPVAPTVNSTPSK